MPEIQPHYQAVIEIYALPIHRPDRMVRDPEDDTRFALGFDVSTSSSTRRPLVYV